MMTVLAGLLPSRSVLDTSKLRGLCDAATTSSAFSAERLVDLFDNRLGTEHDDHEQDERDDATEVNLVA